MSWYIGLGRTSCENETWSSRRSSRPYGTVRVPDMDPPPSSALSLFILVGSNKSLSVRSMWYAYLYRCCYVQVLICSQPLTPQFWDKCACNPYISPCFRQVCIPVLRVLVLVQHFLSKATATPSLLCCAGTAQRCCHEIDDP